MVFWAIPQNELPMQPANEAVFPRPCHSLDQCTDKLIQNLRFYTPLQTEEVLRIVAEVPIKTLKKGSLLLREGQIPQACYYVFKGCVREYYLVDGEEKTSEFYLEGDSISDDLGKIERRPSRKYWECLEDTTLSVFTQGQEEKMFRLFPFMETLCRIETEKKFGQFRELMAFYLASNPEERYLNLLQTRPNLLTRVPQYQLASYLGVKPESLSRIRGRLQSSKERRTAEK
jgi:CRP-like cAMP-binding protein